MTAIRRLTRPALAAGLAAAALAGAALTPSARADVIKVRTDVTVAPYYDPAALLPGNVVDEARGPVMLNVRHTITCTRGTVRRPGYPAMCQWSSALFGASATVGAGQGQGDVYAAGVSGRPIGDTFHAGTLRVGQSGTDDWNVVVRGDDLTEPDEVFRMSVSVSTGGSVTRSFTILDDESRR